MNQSRVPDRLIAHIRRSAETLAACEHNMRSTHVLLTAAHRQLERSRALQRHLDFLNHLHRSSGIQHDTRELSDHR